MSETGQSPPETMSAFTGFPEDGGGRKRLDPTASKDGCPRREETQRFLSQGKNRYPAAFPERSGRQGGNGISAEGRAKRVMPDSPLPGVSAGIERLRCPLREIFTDSDCPKGPPFLKAIIVESIGFALMHQPPRMGVMNAKVSVQREIRIRLMSSKCRSRTGRMVFASEETAKARRRVSCSNEGGR